MYCTERKDSISISGDTASLSSSQTLLSPMTHGSLGVRYESARTHDDEVFYQTGTQCRTRSLCNGREHALTPPQHL